MSFSILQAKQEANAIIKEAIEKDDECTLFLHANLAKEAGEDEYADHLLKLAHQARRNIWGHDEANDN